MMKDYFDPRIPEDMEVLIALVKLNPNIKLEMMDNNGTQLQWNRRGDNYVNGKPSAFSTELIYRVMGR